MDCRRARRWTAVMMTVFNCCKGFYMNMALFSHFLLSEAGYYIHVACSITSCFSLYYHATSINGFQLCFDSFVHRPLHFVRLIPYFNLHTNTPHHFHLL